MSSAFSAVADLVKPGSKRKLTEQSDVSDSTLASEETVTEMDEDNLITFDYQHFNADCPSAKSVTESGLNLANLQFNTLNLIGMFFRLAVTHETSVTV